ncbi:phosphoenolpyruvate carboxykinase domain-containing protein, partial [Acidianus sp. RZ1]|uniref:phosphoenolpyruvate carboxykinase domain-containing protein n=1 Tax=Acidianus sp. RZ1 TaxID=1540082 RepID=UPI001491D371
NWEHGVITMGASMESARTSAVVGKTDEMEFNPMAIIDFMSIHIGKYLENYLAFGKSIKNPPKIFGANYFLKNEKGVFLNSKDDKKVWLSWITKRIEEKSDAIETPVGLIPVYSDLREIFAEVLGKEYTKKDYETQFSIRLTKYKEKFERIRGIYSKVNGMPDEVNKALDEQIERINKYIKKYGDVVSPFNL